MSFSDLYPAVVAIFSEITDNRATWNADSCSLASSLLKAITDFPFLATFTITANILAYVQCLLSSLQEESLDVCQAYRQIDSTRASVENLRTEIDNRNSTWWKEAVEMASSVDVEPSQPRTCGCQRGRDNVPADGPEEYFRRAVTAPLLDELLGQFDTRFGPLQKISKGMCLLPTLLLADPRQAQADIMRLIRRKTCLKVLTCKASGPKWRTSTLSSPQFHRTSSQRLS